MCYKLLLSLTDKLKLIEHLLFVYFVNFNWAKIRGTLSAKLLIKTKES